MMVRQGATYHFRRRVPLPAQSALGLKEVWRSLKTASRPIAKERAAGLYLLTNRVYREAMRDGVNGHLIKTLLDVAGAKIAAGEDAHSLLYEIDAALAEWAAQMASAQKAAKERVAEATFLARAVAEQEDVLVRLHEMSDHQKRVIHNLLGRYSEARNSRQEMIKAVTSALSNRGEPPAPVIAPPPEQPDTQKQPASAFVETYIKAKVKAGITEQHAAEQRTSIRLFLAIAGDKPLCDYRREEIIAYRDTLSRLPQNHGKSSRDRLLSIADIIAKADAEDDVPRLSRTTLDKHWWAAKEFLETASVSTTADNRIDPTILLRHKWDKDTPAAEKRMTWGSDALQTLFTSPLYVGCSGETVAERARPGPLVIKDALYWLPLLGMLTGARAEELARLRCDDVRIEEGIWIVDVTLDGHSRLKNKGSVRKIPLHPELLRCGFLAHKEEVAANGHDRLFPELPAKGYDGKFQREFSRDFRRYRERIGVYRRWMDFHALRTTFITAMLQRGHAILDVDELVGHDSELRRQRKELRSVTVEHYYAGGELKALHESVNSFKPLVSLTHLHVP